MGAILKHCGSDLKTLWERFKNTMGAINRSLCVLFHSCNIYFLCKTIKMEK